MWIENVLGAADAVFQIKNILLMTVGVLAGLIAGAIPGFTITMAVVLTLPFTFALSPIEGLSTMIGVFVGGLSGGLMSGVLTGIPGTPSSVATTFDGFPMARNGRPGLALGSFGMEFLESGFAFLPVLVGLFAFSQLMTDVADREGARGRLMDAGAKSVRVEHLAAVKAIVKDWAHLIRSSLIGAFTGILPAAGGSISNILAYDQAKKADKNPEKFGTGVPAGIIASESANNATASRQRQRISSDRPDA